MTHNQPIITLFLKNNCNLNFYMPEGWYYVIPFVVRPLANTCADNYLFFFSTKCVHTCMGEGYGNVDVRTVVIT